MFEGPEHLFVATRFDFRTVRIVLESPFRNDRFRHMG